VTVFLAAAGYRWGMSKIDRSMLIVTEADRPRAPVPERIRRVGGLLIRGNVGRQAKDDFDRVFQAINIR